MDENAKDVRETSHTGNDAAAARETVAKVKDAGADTASAAAREAQNAAGFASDKAEEMAERGKDAGADQIDGFARAARKAAEDIDEDSPQAARFIRDAAAGAERVSSSIRGRSVEDIIDTVGNFARTQPVAFFGTSVLAGFALTRFLKSSSERAHRQEDMGRRWRGSEDNRSAEREGRP